MGKYNRNVTIYIIPRWQVLYIYLGFYLGIQSTPLWEYTNLQKMSNGNAGTEITMDSVLHSRIPYANPLSSIKELV